jgi:ADP-ribose pyrophosphatase YjhB (NUDIX family)
VEQEQLELGSGGTDFFGVFVYRILNGVLSILTFKYQKEGKRETTKIPGGCMAEGEENMPIQAACNELEQETNLVANPVDLVHVWTNRVDIGKHHQHFFAIRAEKVTGELRTHEMFDGDEKLGRPTWTDVGLALENLFPTHRRALERMIAVLGSARRHEYDAEFRKAASFHQVAARFLAER